MEHSTSEWRRFAMGTTAKGWLLTVSLLVAAAGGAAQDTPPKDMKAREAFYFPKASVQQTGTRTGARQATPASTGAVRQSGDTRGASAPAPPAAPQRTGTAAVLPVTLAPAGTPLALRYSLRKRLTANRSEEVDTDSTFAQGDAIKVLVEG